VNTVLTVEAVDGLLPHATSHAPVDPLVLVALVLQEVLQQVQHLGHLGEDQHAVAAILQLPHHLVQQQQLAGGLGEGAALVHTVGQLGRILVATMWNVLDRVQVDNQPVMLCYVMLCVMLCYVIDY